MASSSTPCSHYCRSTRAAHLAKSGTDTTPVSLLARLYHGMLYRNYFSVDLIISSHQSLEYKRGYTTRTQNLFFSVYSWLYPRRLWLSLLLSTYRTTARAELLWHASNINCQQIITPRSLLVGPNLLQRNDSGRVWQFAPVRPVACTFSILVWWNVHSSSSVRVRNGISFKLFLHVSCVQGISRQELRSCNHSHLCFSTPNDSQCKIRWDIRILIAAYSYNSREASCVLQTSIHPSRHFTWTHHATGGIWHCEHTAHDYRNDF